MERKTEEVLESAAPPAKRRKTRNIKGDEYWEKWFRMARNASKTGDGGQFPVTCGYKKKQHALIHGARFGSGNRGMSVEYPLNSGKFMTPSEFEKLSGCKNTRKYTHSIKFELEPINELINNQFLIAHSRSCKCRGCSDGEHNEEVKYPINNFEKPAQTDNCTPPPTMSPEHQNGARKGHDSPPDDPSPNSTPPRLSREDESVLLSRPPVGSKTVLPKCDGQSNEQSSSSHSANEQSSSSHSANEQSSSSHSANEQLGDPTTPMDTSEVMVQSGAVCNAKKCLRVVEDKPVQSASSTPTVVDHLMGIITNMESKNEELKMSYEQLKKKYDSLEEEKRVQLEKVKQRADELTANHEQMLVKHQLLEDERDQLKNDNRERTERLEQQSQKNARLQQQREQQSFTSEQLNVTVSEMQSSVLRATEQLAQVQEKNAVVVTENDVLRQQIRDKDALLDEYRSIDMKVQV